ncbi:MAG: transporter, partial [Hyphomicrobiales bacterium]|nr:transporter [Hyphomicrobiales bacterium]
MSIETIDARAPRVPDIERTYSKATALRAIILCALVALLDGFDTQVIGFVAPLIAREWSADLSAFGIVFGAGLLGFTIGALLLGPLSDKSGRRRVIIGSTMAIGLFALLTPYTESLTSLSILRFLTGLGLGGAMPNIIALTSEYSPPNRRATFVTLMFVGFPLGAVLGGAILAPIMSTHGWHIAFYVGGALPLLLTVLLFFALPESEAFERARREPVTNQIAAPGRALVLQLFQDHRALGTFLIWIAFFANLLVLYSLINWLPSVLQRSGIPMERAILATAVL